MEKTTDPTFEHEREHLEIMSRELSNIHKELVRFDEAIKSTNIGTNNQLDISEPLLSLSEILAGFYETEKSSVKGAAYRNASLSADILYSQYITRLLRTYEH